MTTTFRPLIHPVLIFLAAVTLTRTASAQYYDPCQPPRSGDILGAIINQMNAQQRALACQQARDAAMRQQRSEAIAQQTREAEAQRAAARARADAEAQARARNAAQVAAERSSDNFCREPDTARNLIHEYNRMEWQGFVTRHVVDIEHLVTIKKDPENLTLICHGIWVHTNGVRLEGTMTMHPNVAGDIVVSWEPNHWEPPASVSSRATTQLNPGTATPDLPNVSPAFRDGLADRKTWEEWFEGSTGDYHEGALYWSAQRSLRNPGSCTSLGGETMRGCIDARTRLAPWDIRRKQEPDYRLGWNSYQ